MKRKPLNLKTRRGRIAKALLNARLNKGLDSKDVAKAMKVTLDTFYKWEQGENLPPGKIAKLKKFYGFSSFEDLFSGIE